MNSPVTPKGVPGEAAQDSPGRSGPPAPADDPVTHFLCRLGPGSVPTMSDALAWFGRTLGYRDPHLVPWHVLRHEQTLALRERLAEHCAPATANKMLAALRGVLKEAWRLGQLSAEDYQRAIDFPSLSGKCVPRGRSLSKCEINALFNACAGGDWPAHARDAAILALGYGAGLRVSEITSLDIEDYNLQTGALLVAGNGARERFVYASNGSKDALEAWLAAHGLTGGPMFCPISKGGDPTRAKRITRAGINLMLKRRAAQAGVKEFSPHDLRRTFIGELLARGADLVTVQHLAGHANPQTTARYGRRMAGQPAGQPSLLSVPYHRPATQ